MCGKTASMAGAAVAKARKGAAPAGMAPDAAGPTVDPMAPPPGEGGSGLMRRRGRPGPASLLSPRP